MRHDGGADDADGEIEHVRILEDPGIRQEAPGQRAERGLGEAQLIGEGAGDDGQHQGDGLLGHPPARERENEQNEGDASGEQHAGGDGKTEEQLEGHGGAQKLGQIRRHHGDLRRTPAKKRQRPRQPLAHQPGEILARGQGQPDREDLQKGRRQARGQHHRKQGEAVARPGRDIRRPIAGIDIAHRDHISRPEQGQQPARRQRRGAVPEGRQAGDEGGHGAS